MNQRSYILTGIFLVLVGIAIAWNYHVYLQAQDYTVQDFVDCDPAEQSCFIAVCEEGDEECDPEWTYKKISESAEDVPACSSYQGDCPALTCEEGEGDCEEQLCSVEVLEEGERCTTEDDIPAEEEEEEAGAEEDELMEEEPSETEE